MGLHGQGDILAISGTSAKLSKFPADVWPPREQYGARCAESWPNGKGAAIGLPEHLGETSIARAVATTLSSRLRECESMPELETDVGFIEASCGQQQFVKRSLVVAASRRAIEILQRGFASCEEAEAALSCMSRLRVATLLAPWKTVRQATASALVQLAGTAPATVKGGALLPAPVILDRMLQHWAWQAQLFQSFSEAELLGPEDAASVETALDGALRRALAGAHAEDIANSAHRMRTAAPCILRAREAAQENRLPQTQAMADFPEAPSALSLACFDAVREAAQRTGPKAVGKAGLSLHFAGLIDPRKPHCRLGRRASSEGLLTRAGSLAASSPRGRGQAPAAELPEVLRRTEGSTLVHGVQRSDLGRAPSHVRSEVLMGIGASGHVAKNSGSASMGIAPVGGSGMSALQKTLLRVHANGPPLPDVVHVPKTKGLVALGTPSL